MKKWDFKSYFDYFDKVNKEEEDRKKIKKRVQEIFRSEYIPINFRFSNEFSYIGKDRRFIINIENKVSNFLKLSIDKDLLEWYDKIPRKSDMIDGGTILFDISGGKINVIGSYYKGKGTIEDDILRWKNGAITRDEYRSLFTIPPAKDQEKFAPSGGGYSGFGLENKIKDVDTKKRDANIKIIRNKIHPVAKVSYEESLRKGKRINRGFVNGTSYKPLRDKNTEKPNKRKLFFIIDVSGSMGRGGEGNPSYDAISFASACYSSGVFDIEHIILHGSSGWKNIVPELKKGRHISAFDGAEGFEVINDNLDRNWIKSADYAVVLTDLEIGSSAQRGLADYLQGIKHLILSFSKPGDLMGLNVRLVKTNKDMINSLVTLVG